MGRQKAERHNERVEAIWKKEGEKDRQRKGEECRVREQKEDKLLDMKEREDIWDAGKEGMGIRATKEKRKSRGTGIPPTFDTSSQTHTHTHTQPHEGQEVSVSIGTAACSVTLYISEEWDSNTRGPRRSP